MIRINKYLAENGGVSRREADRLIEKGAVTVDGEPATVGMMIDEEKCLVCVDSRTVTRNNSRHYYALYKPAGYICSAVRQSRSDRLCIDLIDTDARLFCAGRLDKDSEGLILMTDDGELTDRILRSRYGHEKEYIVELSASCGDDVMEAIGRGGLDIGCERLTKACSISRLSDRSFDIVLTEGMNRQIRRVFELFGYDVISLKRIRFMNIDLTGLDSGGYRELSKDEIDKIRETAAL